MSKVSREDVITVCKAHGVTVVPKEVEPYGSEEPGMLRFCKDEILECLRVPEYGAERKLVSHLARIFDIPVESFYNPPIVAKGYAGVN